MRPRFELSVLAMQGRVRPCRQGGPEGRGEGGRVGQAGRDQQGSTSTAPSTTTTAREAREMIVKAQRRVFGRGYNSTWGKRQGPTPYSHYWTLVRKEALLRDGYVSH